MSHADSYSVHKVTFMKDYPGDEFMSKWVYPFYMKHLQVDNRFKQFQSSYSAIRSQVDVAIISQLLTYGNWRSLKVGSYFAAIENSTTHCAHIGRLLLMSINYHGEPAHVLALARFNTEEALFYLYKYLDQCLQHPEHRMYHGAVMGALAYLDAQNNTKTVDEYVDRWNTSTNNYISELHLTQCDDFITRLMKSIRALSETKIIQ